MNFQHSLRVISIKNDQDNKIIPKVHSKKVRKKMVVFNCSCGAKILIVPDLPEMNKAIEEHLIEHKKLTGKSLSEDVLTQEILIALAEA
jgi:hypothetical protein